MTVFEVCVGVRLGEVIGSGVAYLRRSGCSGGVGSCDLDEAGSRCGKSSWLGSKIVES